MAHGGMALPSIREALQAAFAGPGPAAAPPAAAPLLLAPGLEQQQQQLRLAAGGDAEDLDSAAAQVRGAAARTPGLCPPRCTRARRRCTRPPRASPPHAPHPPPRAPQAIAKLAASVDLGDAAAAAAAAAVGLDASADKLEFFNRLMDVVDQMPGASEQLRSAGSPAGSAAGAGAGAQEEGAPGGGEGEGEGGEAGEAAGGEGGGGGGGEAAGRAAAPAVHPFVYDSSIAVHFKFGLKAAISFLFTGPSKLPQPLWFYLDAQVRAGESPGALGAWAWAWAWACLGSACWAC